MLLSQFFYRKYDILHLYHHFSQLWPSRFSKHCHELAEEHDEVVLYKFWKLVTKDKPDPRRSDLDDLLCFSEEESDCNKYRNPSEYKQRYIQFSSPENSSKR